MEKCQSVVYSVHRQVGHFIAADKTFPLALLSIFSHHSMWIVKCALGVRLEGKTSGDNKSLLRKTSAEQNKVWLSKDQTRVRIFGSISSKFIFASANISSPIFLFPVEVVFHWGRLLLRLSSVDVIFRWSRFPARPFSVEVVFPWGHLPLRSSSIEVFFR